MTDRNMQGTVCLKVSVYSWGHGIWVLSTSFQKSNIGWPQQPPTETVPYISESSDFWWTIPQKNEQYWSIWCHWWSNHQDQDVFRENKALEAVETNEVAEAAEVYEAGVVFKAWEIPIEDFRVILVLEFNNLRTKIFQFGVLKKKIFW